MEKMRHRYRYIARFMIEAKSPIAVGSDSMHLEQDNPVQRDFNGLPFIPATGIAGFLRAKLPHNEFFGDSPEKKFEQRNKPEAEQEPSVGSNVILSDAYLYDGSQVFQTIDTSKLDRDFRHKYENLPIRPHVAIDHKGTAIDGHLFDQEVVYKGSRFKFELRLELVDKDDKTWKEILDVFFRNDFYLGSGQFNGLGEISVVSCDEKCFDLDIELDNYLETSVDLNPPITGANSYTPKNIQKNVVLKTYEISCKNSFVHIGSGFGDSETDDCNYKEEYLEWQGGKPEWKEAIVIPGTSLKGALAHRMAFYANKAKGNTIESLIEGALEQLVESKIEEFGLKDYELDDDIEKLEQEKEKLEAVLSELEKSPIDLKDLFKPFVSRDNNDIAIVFGKPKGEIAEDGLSGKLMISDVYIKDYKEVLFMHNKIDRYTGGTIDTALFSEKVFTFNTVKLEIKSDEQTFRNESLIGAINDLLSGSLPIGGKVNKGHGIVHGKEIEI